jgi:hypothetical protein
VAGLSVAGASARAAAPFVDESFGVDGLFGVHELIGVDGLPPVAPAAVAPA